jgi:DNA polymerase I
MRDYRTLYLIDISSFIFRAFYAVKNLTTADGRPVNAVYGVATMLLRLIDEVKPNHLAIAYDSKEPSFRKKEYPEYKANRSEPPEDLLPQFEFVDRLVSAFGMQSCRIPGVEADDIIATLRARWLKAAPENRVVIVSGDKDLLSLVDERTQLWDTMKDRHYQVHEVFEKLGVFPRQVLDYLAIVGDSSDNIPGVAGIGAKGAVQLLDEYDTLDGVLQAAAEKKVPGKKGEALRNGVESARLSRRLATLLDDVEIPSECQPAREFQFQLSEDLLTLFQEFGFQSLIRKLAGESSVVNEPKTTTAMPEPGAVFTLVNTEEVFQRMLGQLERATKIAIDTETTGLNVNEASLVGVSLCVDEAEGFYIPIGHETGEPQLDWGVVKEALLKVLSKGKTMIAQNLKFDLQILKRHGLPLAPPWIDTMLLSYGLDPNGRHGLDYLAERHLGYRMLTYEEVAGKGAKQVSFADVRLDIAARYSAEDAWATFKLESVLDAKITEANLKGVVLDIDLPTVPVLAEMELTGVKIDRSYLRALEREFEGELIGIEQKVRAYSQQPGLNLNSPKQLSVFLFDELKLPPQGKTKTGYSTDAEVLSKLSSQHPAVYLLLEHRELAKLQGTYVKPLQVLASHVDDRVRTTFHLTGTSTGRLSSSDPNLQNIPARSKRGLQIRSAFVASEGYELISADYSQIELRILAHLSGDEALSRSFHEGEDVHRRTAAEIYAVKANEVTDGQRSVAKAINFGLMYGKTAFGLSEELRISRSEAKQTIDRYFTRYAGVKKYLTEVVEAAKKSGFVTTAFGRRRSIPELSSSNAALRANGERMAMNMPIQGTAADLIKIAMIRVHQKLKESHPNARLLLQVHDELILEAPKKDSAEVMAIVKRELEAAASLNVPLVANASSAFRWGDL